MSFVRFYRYHNQIILPTVKQADNSFYFDAEPVNVCDLNAKNELAQLIHDELTTSRPKVDIPENAETGQSIILDLLDIKKWFQFEREATMFMIHGDKDYYKINVTAHHRETRLWTHDLIGERKLPAHMAIDEVVAMLMRIIDEDVKEEERLKAKENEPKPIRLLPPPPPSKG
jgi:hypothetical protein